MSKRNIKQNSSARQAAHRQPFSWSRFLLALTLLPLVSGVLLVIAWALDIYIWEPPDRQVTLAIFLILFSFAASNAVQKKWILAAGWTFLAISDLLFLAELDLRIQSAGLVLGGMGIILLAVEIFRGARRPAGQ